MIEIVHRYTSAVLFQSKSAATIAEAVAEAVKSRANLDGASLGGAYLRGANDATPDDVNLNFEFEPRMEMAEMQTDLPKVYWMAFVMFRAVSREADQAIAWVDGKQVDLKATEAAKP